MLNIERDIPLTPVKRPNRKKKPVIKLPKSRKYPFSTMKVGDSFFLEGKLGTIAPSASQYNKSLAPKKFCCRTVEGGVRVWRVA